jgi:hypothetical protein
MTVESTIGQYTLKRKFRVGHMTFQLELGERSDTKCVLFRGSAVFEIGLSGPR